MLKKIKIKNFRNFNDDGVELDNLSHPDKNLTIYSNKNGSGKKNITKAIEKALGYNLFDAIDFNSSLDKDIEINFNFDNFVSKNGKTYKNLNYLVRVNKNASIFPDVSVNVENDINFLNQDFFNIWNNFFSLREKDEKSFKKLIREYLFINNKKYSSSKRNHIIVQENNHMEDLENNIQDITFENVIGIFEIFITLNKSIIQNKNDSYKLINDILVHGTNGKESFEIEFIEKLIPLLKSVTEIWRELKTNDIRLEIFAYLKENIVFIKQDENYGKTVNIIDNQKDWLSVFLSFFNATKEDLFKELTKRKNSNGKLSQKVKSKLKEFFAYYLKLSENNDIKIKEIKLIPFSYHENEVVIIRIVDSNNEIYNLENLGSGFLNFFQVLNIILQDKENKIFFTEQLVDSYPKVTKDRLLFFIANKIKSKIVYSTIFLTDKERYENVNDLLLLEVDKENLDSLKEIALLQEIDKLKNSLEIKEEELLETNQKNNILSEEIKYVNDDEDEEFVNLQDELLSLEKENQELNDYIDYLEEKTDTNKTELTTTSKPLVNEKEQSDLLQIKEEKELLQTEINKLNEELVETKEKSNSIIDELKKTITLINENNVEEDKETKKIISELTNQLNEYNEKELQKDNHDDEVNELENKIFLLENSEKELRKNYDTVIEREKELYEQYLELKNSYLVDESKNENNLNNEELESLIDENKDLKEALNDLKINLTKHYFDSKINQSKINEATREKYAYEIKHEKTLMDSNKEITLLNNKLKNNEKEYDELYAKIYLFEVKIDKLEEINEELKKAHQDIELENNKIKVELENLELTNKDELYYANSKHEILQQQYDALEAKKLALEEEDAVKYEKLKLLDSRLLQTELLNDKIEASKIILKKSLENRELVLRDEINDLKRENVEIKDNQNEYQKDLEQLKTTNYEQKIDIDRLEFEVEQEKLSSEKVISEIKNKLDRKHIEHEELKKDFGDSNSKLLETEKDLMSALVQIKQLTQTNNEQKTELEKTEIEKSQEIDELDKKLQEQIILSNNRQVMIESTKKDVSILEEKLDEKNILIEGLEDKLDEIIIEKNNELSNLKDKLIESESMINIITRDLNARSDRVKVQDERIEKFNEQIDELNKLQKETEENNEKLQKETKEENEKLQNELNEQVKTLNNQIQSMIVEKDDFEAKLSDLKEKNNEIEEEKENIKKDLQTLENSETELTNIINDYKLSNERLENQVERLIIKLEKSEEQKQLHFEKAKESLKDLKEANTSVKTLQKENDLLGKKLQIVQDQTESLKIQEVKAQEQNSKLMEISHKLEVEIETLENEIETLTHNNELELSTKDNEIETWKNNFSKLELKLQKANESSNSKDEKLREKTTSIKELKAKLNELQKAIITKNKKLINYEAEIEKHKTNQKELEEQTIEFQAIQNELKEQNDEFEKTINELEDKITSLNEEKEMITEKSNTTVDSLKEKYENKLIKIQEQTQKLKEQKEVAKENAKLQSAKISEMKKAISELEKTTKKQTNIINDENQKLKDKLDNLESQLADSAKENENNRKELIKKQEQEVKDLKAKLAKQEKEFKEIKLKKSKDSNNDLKLEKANLKINQLKETLITKEEENDSLKDKLVSLGKNNNSIDTQNKVIKLTQEKDFLKLKNDELKKRINKVEVQLNKRDEFLRLNNLSEGFEQNSFEKERLILTSPLSTEFIKWIVDKEQILMSEFIYEFIKLPSSKNEIKKVLETTQQKEFSQIFLFVDYDNESKEIFSSKEYLEMKKPYKLSQVKPYFWNMKRLSNSILSSKISNKNEISFKTIIFEELDKFGIKYNPENPINALNLLISKLDKDENAYKKFLKHTSFQKLIRLLKSN